MLIIVDKYNIDQLKNIPAATVERANASIIEHNKTKKSFDSVFAISVIDAQYRCELELQRLKNPEERHVYWPETNPVIGEIDEKCPRSSTG